MQLNAAKTSDRFDSYMRRHSLEHSPKVDVTRVAVAISSLTYAASLVWIYRVYVVPQYSYLGHDYAGVTSAEALLLAILLVSAGSCVVPMSLSRPSDIAVWVVYLMLYIPSQVVPVFTTSSNWWNVFSMQVALFAGLVAMVAVPHYVRMAVPSIKYSERQLWLVIAIVSVPLYLVIFQTYGFRLSMPDLGSSYDIREAYNEATAESATRVAAYAVSWQSRVVNPLIMAIGLVRFRLSIVLIGFLGQLTIYSITGLRSVLFSLLILAVVSILIRLSKTRVMVLILAVGPLVFTWACYAVFVATGADSLLSIFVRRMLITPGLLMSRYLDFFQVHPFAKLSASVLAPFSSQVYDRGFGYEVGAMFAPGTGVNMNAGLWPSGYAEFGSIGILVFSVIFGAYLAAFNSAAVGKNPLIVLPLAALVGWTVVNSSLFTSLSTHGLIIALFLVSTLPAFTKPRNDIEKQKDARPGFRNVA